jgi:tRNA pseudouridine(55) synthase
MDGLFIIDKPAGMTSHDIVQAIRKKFDTKAGHLGTLDPMATGVLPVCVGKATRMGQFFSGSPKIYTGEIRFGCSNSLPDRSIRCLRHSRRRRSEEFLHTNWRDVDKRSRWHRLESRFMSSRLSIGTHP